ncbi:MAG: universal stress protein [Acidimicrobiales bacterium]|nr:universal stress protein [Acidimicrobiales bacterium]
MTEPETEPTNAIDVIVVGTDGSSDAQAAVAFVAGFARQLGCRVLLAHAVGLLENIDPDGATGPAPSMRELAETLIDTDWAEPLRKAGVDFETVVEDGPPVLVLPRLAAAHRAGLIAVASHGRGQASVLPLGSTAHGLVQSSETPVVVIPVRG